MGNDRDGGGLLKPYKSINVTAQGVYSIMSEGWHTPMTTEAIVAVEMVAALEYISKQIYEQGKG